MSDQQLVSVDLSKHMITHMNKELTNNIADVERLNLDQNSISKLENLAHLVRLQQLSASHNCLIKISGLDRLSKLTVLNLAENSICSIEGIQNLTQLVWLNLSGNNIRTVDGLRNNLSLKHVDLSDNTITQLSDLSYLPALKSLLLHGNILRHLNDAGKLLPRSLSILSLAENEITELSQMRNLSTMKKLEQLSLMNNPCISYHHLTHHSDAYRAYVLSWTSHLQVLDGQHITTTERNRADWLITEGIAHKYNTGEQNKLVSFLTSIKFTGGDNSAETDNQESATLSKKMKSRQGNQDSPTASPLVARKDMQGLIRQVIGQERSPVSSTAANLRIPKQSSALPKMSRSRSASRSPSRADRTTPTSRKLVLDSTNDNIPDSITAPSLLPASAAGGDKYSKPHEETLQSAMLDAVQYDVSSSVLNSAAIRIQSLWRGYRTRNLDPYVDKVKHEIRARRLEETVAFLITEMNRQHQINQEGQKVRNCLISGMEQLLLKVEELASNTYLDPSAV